MGDSKSKENFLDVGSYGSMTPEETAYDIGIIGACSDRPTALYRTIKTFILRLTIKPDFIGKISNCEFFNFSLQTVFFCFVQ